MIADERDFLGFPLSLSLFPARPELYKGGKIARPSLASQVGQRGGLDPGGCLVLNGHEASGGEEGVSWGLRFLLLTPTFFLLLSRESNCMAIRIQTGSKIMLTPLKGQDGTSPALWGRGEGGGGALPPPLNISLSYICK